MMAMLNENRTLSGKPDWSVWRNTGAATGTDKGLKGRYEIALVSPAKPATLEMSGLGARLNGHLSWDPYSVSAEESRQFAGNLARQGISQELHRNILGGWDRSKRGKQA